MGASTCEGQKGKQKELQMRAFHVDTLLVWPSSLVVVRPRKELILPVSQCSPLGLP